MDKTATPLPNNETREAMAELRQGNLQAFDSVEALMNALEIDRLTAINAELVEALELADCALSGSNMNMRVVERKVRTALARAKEASHDAD